MLVKGPKKLGHQKLGIFIHSLIRPRSQHTDPLTPERIPLDDNSATFKLTHDNRSKQLKF